MTNKKQCFRGTVSLIICLRTFKQGVPNIDRVLLKTRGWFFFNKSDYPCTKVTAKYILVFVIKI